MIHSKNFYIFFNIIIAIILSINGIAQDVEVPLAEHPRPDLNRPEWMNLNGNWSFEFDTGDVGEDEGWYAEKKLSRKITVPFSWGAPLSGVADEGDIGHLFGAVYLLNTYPHLLGNFTIVNFTA